MIERIIVAVLMNLLTRLYNLILGRIEAAKQKKADDAATDARVAAYKEKVNQAFDGTPVTPEQRKEINDALSDLIRGGRSSNGL